MHHFQRSFGLLRRATDFEMLHFMRGLEQNQYLFIEWNKATFAFLFMDFTLSVRRERDGTKTEPHSLLLL